MREGLPSLLLISDVTRVGEDAFLQALRAAVGGGLAALHLREPSWGDDAMRGLADRVREELRKLGEPPLRILLGRRPELAAELGLDGVHVGGGDPREVARARSIVGPDRLVGYSAHSIEELSDAAGEGADHAYYSPVFGALSKQHPLPAVGLEGLAEACRRSPIPVYALGGVRPAHAGALRRAGAEGAAVIGAVLDAGNPGAAVQGFLEGWSRASPPSPGR